MSDKDLKNQNTTAGESDTSAELGLPHNVSFVIQIYRDGWRDTSYTYFGENELNLAIKKANEIKQFGSYKLRIIKRHDTVVA